MKEDKKLKCKYIFKDDYNPSYVNGAEGGVITGQEFIINFYLQRPALPNSLTYKMKNDHVDVNDPESSPPDLKRSFVRVVEHGIIMNYQTAKDFHKWLGDNIAKMEKIKPPKE